MNCSSSSRACPNRDENRGRQGPRPRRLVDPCHRLLDGSLALAGWWGVLSVQAAQRRVTVFEAGGRGEPERRTGGLVAPAPFAIVKAMVEAPAGLASTARAR